MQNPFRRAPRSLHRARTSRRSRTAVAIAVVAVLAAGGIVSAAVINSGGHHHVAVPATTTAPTSTTPAPSSTTTVAIEVHVQHHRPHHRRRRRRGPVMAPLTGIRVSAKVAARPAVVVKIDNIAEALPQAGVNQADLVYEELVEGGLTRLAAVFQSQYPARVEPVRSGRLTDEGIADDLNHPVLAYSGTNGIFQPLLAAQPVQDVTANNYPALFVRDPGREEPHNLYTNVAALAATDKPAHPPGARLLSFHPAGQRFRGAGVARATGVSIPFPAASIQWAWDAKARLWLRTQDGAADLDTTGAALSANNVIIQFVPYFTSAYATGEGNVVPVPIPEGKLVGKGTVWVLSGGAMVKGTWSRRSLLATTVYKDAKGKVIKVAPGRTWIELAPTGTAAKVSS